MFTWNSIFSRHPGFLFYFFTKYGNLIYSTSILYQLLTKYCILFCVFSKPTLLPIPLEYLAYSLISQTQLFSVNTMFFSNDSLSLSCPLQPIGSRVCTLFPLPHLTFRNLTTISTSLLNFLSSKLTLILLDHLDT